MSKEAEMVHFGETQRECTLYGGRDRQKGDSPIR